MVSYSLDANPDFADFNFSSIWNQMGGIGVSASALFQLAYEARQGRRGATMELSNVIECTLHPAAFQAYQRMHDPLGADYADWFYPKLSQFSEALLYERLVVPDQGSKDGRREVKEPWKEGLQDLFFSEGPRLYTEEIDNYLRPEDYERFCYRDLVDRVSRAEPAKRMDASRQWLCQEQQARIASPVETRSFWGKNQKRDEAILRSLGREISRERICAELDRQRIAVNLPALEAYGFQTWAAAWANSVGRTVVQALFSKVLARRMPVKSRTVSE